MSELEANITSIERIQEYIDLKHEVGDSFLTYFLIGIRNKLRFCMRVLAGVVD